MQLIIHKKKLRVLSAILIAALILSLGMFAPPISGQSSDNEVHAAQNDSLLTLTLTGAKATQVQDYWKDGDRFVKPNAAVPGGYENISVTSGSIYVNTLKTDPATGQALYDYEYDSASLWVYSTAKETWTRIAGDTLEDTDARTLALDQLNAKYNSDWTAIGAAVTAGTITTADADAQRIALSGKYDYDRWAIGVAKYVKPAFEFRFDSKHIGKLATIRYTNSGQTKAEYGTFPSQILGGYFGDINDYATSKTNIETFKLAKGAKKLALKKAVFLTLKVTPVSAPYDGDVLDTDADKWINTNGNAYLIQGNAGGAADMLLISPLTVNSQRFNGAKYENVYQFTNPKTGTFVFPALEGQKLIFQGWGRFQDGAKKTDGSEVAVRAFQAQWLGGYKNNDIVGNPKNVKKIAVGKANKTVGTIKLTKGTGKIRGTITGMNTGTVAAGGVVGDHYNASGQLLRDTVAATFADYAAFMEDKTEVAVNRLVIDNTVPATEAEYPNNAPGYRVSMVRDGINGVTEISEAEYDALPDDLKPNLGDEGKVWIGPKQDAFRYYKYNWVEISKAVYDTLPSVLRVQRLQSQAEGYPADTYKYYQKTYLTDVASLADYNALNFEFQGGTYVDAAGTTHWLKANYLFRKSPEPVPATEAEYIAYVSAPTVPGSGNVYNGGPVSIDADLTGFVEIAQAEYDALPAYWDAGNEKKTLNGKFYRMNMTEIPLADYSLLPSVLQYSTFDGVSFTSKYFRKDDYTAIDKLTYDALADASMGVEFFNTTTGAYQYYKRTLYYEKELINYAYWKDAVVYTIEDLASGVYFVSFGGQVKVVAVKNGKTTSANFKKDLKNPDSPTYLTEITGTKGKGKTLTAKTRITQPGFGQSTASYKYYWTNGTKIISKKAAYKVSKSYAKKNLWVLSVATFKKYQTVAQSSWVAAPGNTYGVIGFDVTVTGTFKKGKKVKAVIANEQVSGVKYKYQWLRNGKAIKKATKSSYKITKADKNKKISVKVTGTVEGYTSKSVKSKATKSK